MYNNYDSWPKASLYTFAHDPCRGSDVSGAIYSSVNVGESFVWPSLSLDPGLHGICGSHDGSGSETYIRGWGMRFGYQSPACIT